jgi:hypothetical protein
VTDWIDGLPVAPGDYWFYQFVPGYPNLSNVEQGKTFYSANLVLMHVAGDFLSEPRPPGKIWHMPLTLPDPPEVDRTCPECAERGETSQWCRTCWGKGEI